jgi:hypothetical protein
MTKSYFLKAGIKNSIIEVLNRNGAISKQALSLDLKKLHPNANGSAITWNLYQLKKQGLIQSIGRGVYSLSSKKQFSPEISSSLKRLHNKIAKEFPFIQICVWDSRWFNDLMLHQLFKYYLVIEVEKESAESVFNTMTDVSKKVFLNPTEDIFTRYISNFNEVIIVKSLISESPIVEQDQIRIAPLEKLLVDSISDLDLFASQQSEIDYIFNTASEKYNINV